MCRIYSLIFFVLLSTNLISQELRDIGTHKMHLEEHGNNSVEVTLNNTHIQASALNMHMFEEKEKIVFGYLPYWELGRGALENIQFDLLTHIALFNFAISADGNFTAPKNWPWTDIIDKAHLNGCKVIVSFTNFDLSDDDNYNLFTDETKYTVLFDNIINLVESYNLDGVNIDFESLDVNHRGAILNSFMQKLNNSLKSEISNIEISFASPAVNWGGWDFEGLINTVDYLFIMAYDYNGSWSSNSGPISPLLNPSGGISVTRTLERDYADIVSSSPEKLILGVPYYGKKWKTQTSDSYSSVIDYVGSTFYKDDVLIIEEKGKQWEVVEKSPWYYWLEETWMQVWTEDSLSLSYKYDLAIDKELGGIGIWALNYDSNRTELWDLIKVKFYDDNGLGLQALERISNYNVYPNPTKGEVFIKNLEGNYKIEVFDSKANLMMQSYNYVPNIELLSAGLYYLRVYDEEGSAKTFKVVKE